ncbi:MAG: DHA2 family efflux MFS transporter permease subunit [Pseudomonadota bacterium]
MLQPQLTTDFDPYCPAARKKYVLVAAILASAMGFIDGSVVAIAIPAIRESLDASLVEVQWVNNAYMLALSALILVGGAAGDRFGLRRVFGLGIGAFVLASLVCAVAPNASVLIAARVAQGAAAALMVPGSLAIISKTYPESERAKAIGVWAAASAMTTALGPILGGLLLSLGDADVWRWIFAINLPIGAIALGLLWLRVPPDAPATAHRLDWVGAVLATAALGLLAWGLTGAEGEHSAPTLARMSIWGAAGLLCLLVFIRWEVRVPHPMMPPHLFASRAFSVANLVTFGLYFALSGVLFYLPMTLISGWQLPEAQVGLMFMPLTVAIAVGSGPVGRLASRIGARPLIAGGSLVVGLSYAGLALAVQLQTFWGGVLPALCAMGIGMALIVAPLSVAVMGAVGEDDAGAASGINNAVSRVAGLVAVAGLGGVASAAYRWAGGEGAFGAEPGQAAAMSAGFAVVAALTALIAFASAFAAQAGLPRS